MNPLHSFLRSILLGASAALGYDLLRPLRRRFPRLTPVLDLGFAASCCAGGFLFLLRCTEGELRAFLVLGAGGGWVLFRCLFSSFLQSIWDFWAATAGQFVSILSSPLFWSWDFCKNKWKQAKNLFYFAGKYYTIKRLSCGAADLSGGNTNAQKKQSSRKAKEGTRPVLFRHKSPDSVHADRRRN